MEAGKKAVHDFLESKGYDTEVTSSPVYPTMYRIKYAVSGTPLISVIVDMKYGDESSLKLLEELIGGTGWKNIEWIVLTPDMPSGEREGIRYIVSDDGRPAARLNAGAEAAQGEYITFIAGDLVPDTPDWIEEMLMLAQRECTGAVGGKILFNNGFIRHGGIILKLGRQRTAARSHFRVAGTNSGYYGALVIAGNKSAVTAECMMISKDTYESVGGFDESLGYALFDVDMCLKLRERGFLTVFTPYALFHGGSQNDLLIELGREDEHYDQMRDIFKARWRTTLEQGDPYYNPNLSLDTFDFRPATVSGKRRRNCDSCV